MKERIYTNDPVPYTITVHLSEEDLETLKRLAHITKKPKTVLARLAIREMIYAECISIPTET